jgi:TonB-dependent receptor
MLLERIARTVLAAVVSSQLLIAQTCAEELEQIDVPAGDLALALERLAKETNINLLYQATQMRGLKTPGVRGNLTPRDAVLQLLQGTSLRLTIDEATGAMMISSDDAGPSSNALEEVVVTGYKLSLDEAAAEKQKKVNFTDSIFAEDIGKFPDLNLAESLQRLPGVQIDRDASGEGTYINVRGLSAGFTILTLNGFEVSTPGDGNFTGGANEGRGSSLDMLPSELFRRVTLSKSPTASMAEGGTAGSVDLQPVRAFDRKGFHLDYQLQDTYQTVSGNQSPRGAVFMSNTWDTGWGDFGALIGGAYAEKKYRSDIFNTVGYTTLNLGSRCPSTQAGCNSLALTGNASNPTSGYGGGAGATLITVPAHVPSELGFPAAGQPLMTCGNGAPGGTSGLSCQDLSYVIVPRLVRAEQVAGERYRKTATANLEWRPIDTVSFKLDTIYTDTHNEFLQNDLMVVVRSFNNNIPVNFEYDTHHVLTSGTFANAQFLSENGDYRSDAGFFYRALSVDWQINDEIGLTAQAMRNDGDYDNVGVRYLLQTPATGGGLYATYRYTPGDPTPFLQSNVDLLSPAVRWEWNSIGIVPVKRTLDQTAYQFGVKIGHAQSFMISTGASYAQFFRNIGTWNTGSCAFNLQGCGPTSASFTSQYPGATTTIPNSALAGYLVPLPYSHLFEGSPFNVGFNSGWLIPVMKRFYDELHVDYFVNDIDPGSESANYLNSYSPRVIADDTAAGYVMADGELKMFGRILRYNVGLRYAATDSMIRGIVNDSILLNGAGSRVAGTYRNSYAGRLPSGNFAYLLTSSLLLRGAAARTLTRPNPGDLAPNFSLSLDGDSYSRGNPYLQPYFANNFDLGIEWYPKSKTVLTFNVWAKDIKNYTALYHVATRFDATGINFAALSERQQLGITNLGNGDPNAALIDVIERQNSPLVIHLVGQEAQWNQPLDFLLHGMGFTANVTRLDQHTTGSAPAGTNLRSLLTGLAPWTYNATVYYERRGGLSLRLSYTHRDSFLSTACPCNNIPGDLYSIASNYLDASASFPLPFYPSIKITLQAQNLTDQVLLNRYENRESQPDGATYPGRTFVMGLRGSF